MKMESGRNVQIRIFDHWHEMINATIIDDNKNHLKCYVSENVTKKCRVKINNFIVPSFVFSKIKNKKIEQNDTKLQYY